MKDRREYQRILTNIDCIVYYENKEYNGIIKDLCEIGLKIQFTDDIDIKIPTQVYITFIDPETDELIQENIYIIRKKCNEYGCQIRGSVNDTFYKYVLLKKMKMICKNKKKKNKFK